MHAEQDINLFPGAISACAVPVGLGVLSVVFMLSSPDYYGALSLFMISICFLPIAPLRLGWLVGV